MFALAQSNTEDASGCNRTLCAMAHGAGSPGLSMDRTDPVPWNISWANKQKEKTGPPHHRVAFRRLESCLMSLDSLETKWRAVGLQCQDVTFPRSAWTERGKSHCVPFSRCKVSSGGRPANSALAKYRKPRIAFANLAQSLGAEQDLPAMVSWRDKRPSFVALNREKRNLVARWSVLGVLWPVAFAWFALRVFHLFFPVKQQVSALIALVLPALRQRMEKLHPAAAARAEELLQAEPKNRNVRRMSNQTYGASFPVSVGGGLCKPIAKARWPHPFFSWPRGGWVDPPPPTLIVFVLQGKP